MRTLAGVGEPCRANGYPARMVFFDPSRPAYRQNPYPALAALREREPVHWSRDQGLWVVTSYEHCIRLLLDDEAFSSNPIHATGGLGAAIAATREMVPLGGAPILANADPPDHTRLKAIVNRGFTPRAIADMRPGIEAAVELLLETAQAAQPFEVMSQFAEPLAVGTILEHLGIPTSGAGQFREWSGAVMRARTAKQPTASELGLAARARNEMLDYLALIDSAGEATGVLARMLEAHHAQKSITPEDLLMMLIHISLAGNGATAFGIANSVATLAAHPEQRARLIADPGLLPVAIEELLRFESSTHAIVRFAKQECMLGTRQIRAGQILYAMVAAANRDPAQFVDPDTLDLGRTDNRHLGFSVGMHFCLGAPLVRLELEIALGAILERFGEYRVLTAEPGDTWILRGPRRLVIA